MRAARWSRLIRITAFAAAGFSVITTSLAADIPEPATYRMDDYRAPVPATLKGARVISGEEARQIWLDGKSIFVDVMPRVPKPPNLPPEIIWRDKVRENIPGSAWLPDVGYGLISAQTDAYFRRNLSRLTGGDLAKLVVFYCIADCWMSWNAAKRALEEYGYRNVIWFPDGTEAWAFDGHELKPAQPEP